MPDAHVDAHQPVHRADLRDVQVSGTDDAHAVDVDELVVDHVLDQQHLTFAALEVGQVQPRRAQHDLAVGERLDLRRRERTRAGARHGSPGR